MSSGSLLGLFNLSYKLFPQLWECPLNYNSITGKLTQTNDLKKIIPWLLIIILLVTSATGLTSYFIMAEVLSSRRSLTPQQIFIYAYGFQISILILCISMITFKYGSEMVEYITNLHQVLIEFIQRKQ